MTDRDTLLKQYEHKRRMKHYKKQFEEWLSTVRNGSFVLTSDYDGNYSEVKIKHLKCGFERPVTPAQFKQNSLCPVCDEQAKQSEESFKYKLKLKYGDEYTLLSSFKNVDTKVYLFHKDCGKVIKVRPSSITTSGTQCSNCYGTNKLSCLDLQQRLHKINSNLFVIDTESSREHIIAKYLDCGHIRIADYKNFVDQPKCPECSKIYRRRHESLAFADKINKWNLVTIHSKYEGLSSLIDVKCKNCGWEWPTNPGPLKYGHGCPKCNQSRGEHTITLILDKAGIKYYYPYKAKGLRDKRVLRYDFYIPDQSILIEYQGGQHYNPVDYFGGEERFKKQQEHDRMKSDYAKEHGLKLIAIPYTKETISEIKDFLVNNGLKLKEE